MFKNRSRKSKFLLLFFLCLQTSFVNANEGSPPSIDIIENKQNIRIFVNYNYRLLANNIVNGEGLYLDNLLSLISKKHQSDQKTLDDLKLMLILHPEIGDFAREVADYWENN